MALKNFSDGITTVDADWLNHVDRDTSTYLDPEELLSTRGVAVTARLRFGTTSVLEPQQNGPINDLGVLAVAYADAKLALVRDTGGGMQFEWDGSVLDNIAFAPSTPLVVVTLEHVWFINGSEIWVYERVSGAQVAYVDDTSSGYLAACAAGPNAIFVTSDYQGVLYDVTALTMTSDASDAQWTHLVPASNDGIACVACRDKIIVCYNPSGLAIYDRETGSPVGPVPVPYGSIFLPNSLCSDGRHFFLASKGIGAETYIEKFSPYSGNALGRYDFPAVMDTNIVCDRRQLYFAAMADINIVDISTMQLFATKAAPIDVVDCLDVWCGVDLVIGRSNTPSQPSWVTLSTGRDLVTIRMNTSGSLNPPLQLPSYESE